jgi:hypothetical protein
VSSIPGAKRPQGSCLAGLVAEVGVCAENVIRIDLVTESLNVSADGRACLAQRDGASRPATPSPECCATKSTLRLAR